MFCHRKKPDALTRYDSAKHKMIFFYLIAVTAQRFAIHSEPFLCTLRIWVISMRYTPRERGWRLSTDKHRLTLFLWASNRRKSDEFLWSFFWYLIQHVNHLVFSHFIMTRSLRRIACSVHFDKNYSISFGSVCISTIIECVDGILNER